MPANRTAVVSAGWLGGFCLLPTLPLALFLAPHPPDPLPGGKGETQSLFRRGLRPRHPCTEPPAALTASAMRAPRARSLRFAAKTIGSGSLLAVPAAKERGDRGRGTSAFEMVLSPGAGIASAARLQPRGCKGRSPLHKKSQSLPLPRRGRGAGGWGQKIKLKAGRQAANKASPPPGTFFVGAVSAARVQPRGCKGRSPLHKKQKISPFPGGEGGRGDGGSKES